MKLNKLNDTAEHMEKLTFLFCLVLLMVFIVIGVNMFASLEQNNTEIETMRSEIIALQSNGSGNKTQEQIHLDFLENEMVRHQDFIETQRQHLMWLVSLIGTIGIFLIGFFGFRTRAEIQNTIANQEMNISTAGINHYIGGNENRQYLETAIQKERNAQKAHILFIQTEYRGLKLNNENEKDSEKIFFEDEARSYLNADMILKHLPTDNKNAKKVKKCYEKNMEITLENRCEIKNDFTDDYKNKIETELYGNDLIIYEIPNRGSEIPVNKGKTDKRKEEINHYNETLKSIKEIDYELCKFVCDFCEENSLYCIVYVNGGYIRQLENLFNSTIASYQPNLIQTATTILYLYNKVDQD